MGHSSWLCLLLQHHFCQWEHSNKCLTTSLTPRLFSYELYIKSQIPCQLAPLTSIWLVTFNHLWPLPFSSLPRSKPQATRLYGNLSRSVPREGEWAGLTSVWPFTRGQCQLANMAHSILPYGAIAYVPLAGLGDLGLPWAAGVNGTDTISSWSTCRMDWLHSTQFDLWNKDPNVVLCFFSGLPLTGIQQSLIHLFLFPVLKYQNVCCAASAAATVGKPCPMLMRLCIKILLGVIMSHFYSKVNMMPMKSWKDPLIEGLCSARQVIFVKCLKLDATMWAPHHWYCAASLWHSRENTYSKLQQPLLTKYRFNVCF